MSVVEAVTAELEKRNALGSALGATALAMARELDDMNAEQECEACGHVQSWTVHPNSATSKSMCGKTLMDALVQLRATAPLERQGDRVDEIAKRRKRRLGVA